MVWGTGYGGSGGELMITVRMTKELRARLDELAAATGRSRSYYVRQAIEEFLDDRDDYLVALSVLEKQEPTMSSVELRHELGI